MTIILDVIDNEAQQREEGLDRAREAVSSMVVKMTTGARRPSGQQLYGALTEDRPDLDEVSIVIAVAEAINP